MGELISSFIINRHNMGLSLCKPASTPSMEKMDSSMTFPEDSTNPMLQPGAFEEKPLHLMPNDKTVEIYRESRQQDPEALFFPMPRNKKESVTKQDTFNS